MYPLFVHRFGRTGSVILLIHGLGASGRLWRPVAERFADGIRIVCPDLLGFGRSPRPPLAYSLADHLNALDDMLDALGLGGEPVVLGGTSAGAVLALEWAAARPARFRGLSLSALPVYRSAGEAEQHIASLSPLAWATVARPGVGELICGVMCMGRPLWRAIMPLMTPGVPADIARDFVLHDWVSYSGTLLNLLVDHRIEAAAKRLAEARMPVRLLHGTHDRTAPIEPVRDLAAQLGWQLAVLDGRKHRLPLDAPDACAHELRLVMQQAIQTATA